MKSRTRVVLALGASLAFLVLMCGLALAAGPKKPNILLIMSDDVGITNLSAYSSGLVV